LVAAVRAPWTSASFLLYAGGLTFLLSVGALLGVLASDYADAAFIGWAGLVFVVLAVVANAFRRAGRHVSAGLFAVSAVLTFVVLAGAVENWLGWLAETDAPFDGFHLGNLLLALAAVVAALVARTQFRFPLLTLVALVAAWYLVTDALSNGGWWTAVVSLFFGLLLLAIGIGADRVHGLWVHVVAGVTIGGALLYFWHTSDLDWVLVALASVAYVAVASGLARSSYAVLGAIGLFLVTTHFVLKWFIPFAISFVGQEEPPKDHPWAAALSYAAYGLVLMLLGLWFARRRQPPEPA
jgi:hypothetical protein